MYRLRSADKGRPLIISDKVIREYSVNNLDTLHKKNLLALGEDRYLTTLMMKHFPQMSYKFVQDAYALTEAPATWSVLLSQRRRWINSTIHNLAELFWIKDLCGFCCFSLRVVVFVDLFGTIILPATCAYLVYLIYRVASHTGQFPLISLIMLAAVYGLQAVIFIIKRQWQHVGWMIIYLLAYPIYSFVLPVYSFWKQDDFSWGNTRIVIGEKGDKQILAVDNEGFNPRSIPLQRWDDYAVAHGLAGRRTIVTDHNGSARYEDGVGYEMDDTRSQYTAHQAPTVLSGYPQRHSYFPPQRSPSPYNALTQQNSYVRYADTPTPNEMQLRHMSMGAMSDAYSPMAHPYSRAQSQDNLLSAQTPPLGAHASRSVFGAGSRPVSTNEFATMAAFTQQGPTEQVITQAIRECLAEVDLDSVTKKQLKALTEQKLQCQLQGDKRAFLDAQIDLELANM